MFCTIPIALIKTGTTLNQSAFVVKGPEVTLDGESLTAWSLAWKRESKLAKTTVCKNLRDYEFVFSKKNGLIVIAIHPIKNFAKTFSGPPWKFGVFVIDYVDVSKGRIVKAEIDDE